MRISDWSSDVCSSDLRETLGRSSIKRSRPIRTSVGAVLLRASGSNTFFSRLPKDESQLPQSCLAWAVARSKWVCADAGSDSVPDLLVFLWKIGRASCGESVCHYV